ncbi:MAG: hypothetical protein ACKO2P_14715 [Planctomycetota bacterium]
MQASKWTTVELVRGYLAESRTCERLLFDRYKSVCEAMAACGLSSRLRRVCDPEDISQNAQVILATGLRSGKFRISLSGQLRKLLQHIIRLQIMKTAERHTAACRDLRRNRSLDDVSDTAVAFRESMPCDDQDEISRFISNEPNLKKQLIYRSILAGKTTSETAAEVGCTRVYVSQVLRDACQR